MAGVACSGDIDRRIKAPIRCARRSPPPKLQPRVARSSANTAAGIRKREDGQWANPAATVVAAINSVWVVGVSSRWQAFTGRHVPPSPQCCRHRRLDSEVTRIRRRCGEELGEEPNPPVDLIPGVDTAGQSTVEAGPLADRSRLLEDDAVFVLDGNVFHVAIRIGVRCAVMLGLDDNGPELAKRAFHGQHVADDREVRTLSANVADENGKSTFAKKRFVAAAEAAAQDVRKLLVRPESAQVARVIVAVTNDVPIGRMEPDEVKWPWQRVRSQIEAGAKVGAPVVNVVTAGMVQSGDDVFGRS